MNIITTSDNHKTAVSTAIDVLGEGGLVAVPTETVYGLAADATNGIAVAGIFVAKRRPQFNPLICHVASLEMAELYGEFDTIARKLAVKFWPGPLTLVVPRKPDCGLHDLVSAGLDTIALRHPLGIVGEIAAQLGAPLAAPSANTSGRISPTTARHVVEDLGDKADLIIDGGACAIGLESTIVKVTDDIPVLLRTGGIPVEELERLLQCKLFRTEQKTPVEAPGMMTSHYAPKASLRMNAADAKNGEAFLAFGDTGKIQINLATVSLNLSPDGDLMEAAANLYSCLKQLDASGADMIAVQKIPKTGLGEAINDRLRRAAAPRERTS